MSGVCCARRGWRREDRFSFWIVVEGFSFARAVMSGGDVRIADSR